MTRKYEYNVFPTTFKARLLLAAAFVSGLAVLFGWIVVFVIISLSLDRPCSGSDLDRCLQPQGELATISRNACEGFERRICLAPLGRVSPDLVHHLAAYYEEQYGLSITVLTPRGIPRDLVDDDGEQIDALPLIEYMLSLHPGADDHNAVLIGVTPVDIYDSRSHFRFLFGLKGNYQYPQAVISTYRMDPRTFTFGIVSDDDLMFSRARKLFTKYVGILYYGLLPSDDPASPMFDSILSTRDLDNMQEPLDVPAGY